MTQQFAAYGYDIVDSGDHADVYVINSCTVTASGDKKTRQMIHRIKRENPGAVIAMTGCFPQAFPEEAQKLSEVDVLVGAGEKKKVLDYVNEYLQKGERIVRITPHTRDEGFEQMSAGSFLERTRAFVKIQDGCEHYCAYCIIPYARGFNRSKPLEELKQELIDLSLKGYREVVLVGIDLSSYGKDLGCHLVDAVQLACDIPGIERVRLGSLEPLMLTDRNLSILAALPKFCPQFHLSLQSGCDATLKRMNRHYDTAFYRELVARIRRQFDNPSITTDIMVGFPGETEEEFEQSLAFAREIGFAKVHVFAYSVRPGHPRGQDAGPADLPAEGAAQPPDGRCDRAEPPAVFAGAGRAGGGGPHRDRNPQRDAARLHQKLHPRLRARAGGPERQDLSGEGGRGRGGLLYRDHPVRIRMDAFYKTARWHVRGTLKWNKISWRRPAEGSRGSGFATLCSGRRLRWASAAG